MIETIRQGLKEDGHSVSISKLCRWFGVPRRSVYYRPMRRLFLVLERFAQPIKQLIEEKPTFGYRTVAHLLSFNKNTEQRIFQLMRWRVKKRSVGFRPRLKAMPSVAAHPNERWWCGVVEMARPLLRSLWTATAASSWDGISRAVADLRPLRLL